MFATELAFSNDGTDKPVHIRHKCIIFLHLRSCSFPGVMFTPEVGILEPHRNIDKIEKTT